MQAVRHLGRRLNPRVVRARITPSVQEASQEAQNAKDDILQQKIMLQDMSKRDEIEQLFREIDTNEDGELDMDELAWACRKGKMPTSYQVMEQLFHQIDTKQTGTIDLEEFTTFCMLRMQKLRIAYKWIMEHQTKFKERRHGFSASTFRTAAKKSGVHLSDSDLRCIMSRLDQNGNKFISYEEFVNCMLLAPEINPKCFLDNWYTESFCDDAESQFTLPREIRLDDEGDVSFKQLAAKKMGCGGLAGCISRTLTAPIDRLRILMMTSSERIGIQGALTAATAGGGYTRLWMGNGANCLKITPEMAVKLLGFDLIKNQIARDPSNVSVPERFVAGGMAGVLSQLSIYPLEVVKTRLAVAAPGETLGMVNCARQTMAEGGYRAFYAGMLPSVIGIIPYAAIDLSLNSIFKDYAADYLQQAKQETSTAVILSCGMASSGTATISTFPLNVIRTKAQATGQSFGQVLTLLYSQGGWHAFYRGLVPCLAKVLPAASVSYGTYEYLSRAWDTSSNPTRNMVHVVRGEFNRI